MAALAPLLMEAASPASSPRPELMGYDALHPVCVMQGVDDHGLAPRFCAAVAAELARRGHAAVEPVTVGDARLGQPRHVTLGFTLTVRDDRLLIAALLSRVDRPSGALLPPPAEAIPLEPGGTPGDAALAAAAARLVGHIGL